MKRRAYTGAADLQRLQAFNAAAIAVTDHCGYLHPGDIPHHIYNGNRGYDPTELLAIWEDDQGVAAWVLANLRHKGFDAQVRPDLRGDTFEREVLAYAWERTGDLMRRHAVAGGFLHVEGFRGDNARVRVLTALGWEVESGPPFVLTRTPISAMPKQRFTIYSARTGIWSLKNASKAAFLAASSLIAKASACSLAALSLIHISEPTRPY